MVLQAAPAIGAPQRGPTTAVMARAWTPCADEWAPGDDPYVHPADHAEVTDAAASPRTPRFGGY